jgi:hypothetical protein
VVIDAAVTNKDSIDGTTVIRRNPRVVSRSLAGQSGAVLLHLDTAAYHGVNEVGELVWNLVNEGIRFDDLITELQGRLEDMPSSLTEDIVEFLHGLSARGLIVLEPASPSTG